MVIFYSFLRHLMSIVEFIYTHNFFNKINEKGVWIILKVFISIEHYKSERQKQSILGNTDHSRSATGDRRPATRTLIRRSLSRGPWLQVASSTFMINIIFYIISNFGEDINLTGSYLWSYYLQDPTHPHRKTRIHFNRCLNQSNQSLSYLAESSSSRSAVSSPALQRGDLVEGPPFSPSRIGGDARML